MMAMMSVCVREYNTSEGSYDENNQIKTGHKSLFTEMCAYDVCVNGISLPSPLEAIGNRLIDQISMCGYVQVYV